MDRLGVTFNRTGEGFIDRRRFGGHLVQANRFCRCDHGPAIALRARRTGASSGSGRASEEVRVLGLSGTDSG